MEWWDTPAKPGIEIVFYFTLDFPALLVPSIPSGRPATFDRVPA